MFGFLKRNKGFISYLGFLISDKIVGLGLLYFLARSATDENFVFWTQINVLPGLLCGILSFGLGRGILRILVGEKYSQSVVSRIIVTVLLLYLFVIFACYLFILYLDNDSVNVFFGGETSPRFGTVVIIVFILLEGFFEVLINYLRSKISPKFATFVGLRILPRIVFGVAFLIYETGFWMSLYMCIISSLIILLYLIWVVLKTIRVKQPLASFDLLEYKGLLLTLLKYSVPIMIGAIAFPLLSLFVRGNVVQGGGYSSLGIFSVCMSFVGILIYFPEAFQGYIFPKLAELADAESGSKKDIYVLFGSPLFIAGVICFVFAMVGPFFLEMLYPKAFWTHADSILISLTAFFWSLYFTLQRFFLVYLPNKTYLVTYCSFLSLLVATYISYSSIAVGSAATLVPILVYFVIASCTVGVMIKRLTVSNMQLRQDIS